MMGRSDREAPLLPGVVRKRRSVFKTACVLGCLACAMTVAMVWRGLPPHAHRHTFGKSVLGHAQVNATSDSEAAAQPDVDTIVAAPDTLKSSGECAPTPEDLLRTCTHLGEKDALRELSLEPMASQTRGS
eukprot:SAG31_NODE_2183_length_6238_cov_4.637917_2_plen_130_part_00